MIENIPKKKKKKLLLSYYFYSSYFFYVIFQLYTYFSNRSAEISF